METHRDVIRNVFLGSIAIAGLAPSRANAGFFGGSDVEEKVDEVAKSRARVEEVIKSIKKKELRGGPEDSLVVYRYSEAYFKPTQQKMAELVKVIQLGDAEKQKRFETLPLLLLGEEEELWWLDEEEKKKIRVEDSWAALLLTRGRIGGYYCHSSLSSVCSKQ